ncbi:MAG: HmuY family protein [Myxococcota bacterium]
MARFLPALLSIGCLMPDLSDTLDPGPDGATAGATDAGGILVDATDEKAWVTYDLDQDEFGGLEDEGWDLAFRRFQVDLAEGLAAAAIEGVTFEEVVDVPSEGWRVDEPDADDDGIPEYALGDWYDYDFDAHLLSPAARIYVVESTEGRYFKVGFENYYDEAGTPARLTFRTAELDAP